MYYTLHRHVLRVSQAYVNSLREATAAQRRLYIVTASDDVKQGEQHRFTEKDREAAMRIANLRHTKYLSAHLAIYVGMRVLLFGKACVRLGLMNGCECAVEQIILADEEPDFEDVQVGTPTYLTYMPAGLVLRNLDAEWTLPTHTLPPLPRGYDRRGLFVLRPTTEYFSMTATDRKALQIRRIQFSIVAASARIVYNAQGESFHATVADLAIPPGMSAGVHWLACYVMLSRARSLDGLLILRLATREQLAAGAPAYLLKAVDRLLVLERKTTKLMRKHLQEFRDVLPPAVLNLFDDTALQEETLAFAATTEETESAAPASAAQPSHVQAATATTPSDAGSKCHAASTAAIPEPLPSKHQDVGSDRGRVPRQAQVPTRGPECDAAFAPDGYGVSE